MTHNGKTENQKEMDILTRNYVISKRNGDDPTIISQHERNIVNKYLDMNKEERKFVYKSLLNIFENQKKIPSPNYQKQRKPDVGDRKITRLRRKMTRLQILFEKSKRTKKSPSILSSISLKIKDIEDLLKSL
jgi:hypothetical protein